MAVQCPAREPFEHLPLGDYKVAIYSTARGDDGLTYDAHVLNGVTEPIGFLRVSAADPDSLAREAARLAQMTGSAADDAARVVRGLVPLADKANREGPPPAAEWSAPVPFDQYALPAFPTAALPSPFGEFVEALAVATQTPPDLAALLVLPVIATALARVAVVQPRDGWREPVNLYVAVGLDSGNRKSAVVSEVIAPLARWEETQALTKALDVAEAVTRRKILEGQLAQAESAVAKADGEKDATARAVELARDLAKTTVPTVPRLVADEVTPERCATLARDNDGCIALLTAEGGEVFDILSGRYSSAANTGVLLKGHAGDPLRIDLVGRAPEYVRFPRITVGMAVQRDVFRGLAALPSLRGRGLLARFLYGIPESWLGRRAVQAPPVPDAVRAKYADTLGMLLGLSPHRSDDGTAVLHTLTFAPDARHRLHSFMAWVEPQLAPDGELGLLTDWGGKLAGAVARIAGILHGAAHPACPWAADISADTVGAAIGIGKYLIPHARAVFAEMGSDPETEGARHVLAWIERTGAETFSKRTAFEGTKGRFKTVAALDPALRLLVAHDYIRERPAEERQPGKPGRKQSPTYDVNPH